VIAAAIAATQNSTSIVIEEVLTSDEPRTLAIDEPGSFLHLGAARKLIEILMRYPHHQYIISTHSPEIIGMLAAARVFLVSLNGARSVIEQIDRSGLDEKRRVLKEIGAKLADVYCNPLTPRTT
jgi:predicted ATPase